MFLPFGDDPNPPRAQWITRILLGINIAVHLFVSWPLEQKPVTREDLRDPEIRQTVEEMWKAVGPQLTRHRISEQEYLNSLNHYDLFVFRNGYKPGAPSILALFLCMFLHSGWLHLIGNMLYLWIFGDNVEYRFGKIPYVIGYLGTGVVATLSFAMLNSSSMIPLVGASGAISGVLGFYLVWFPHNQVRVLIFFFFITMVHVPATIVLFFYLIVDNILPLLAAQSSGGGGVAHAAHIGGFVAGALVALLFKGRWKAPPRPPRAGPRQWAPPGRVREVVARPVRDPGLEFESAIAAGRMEDAAHAFSRLVREGGAPPDADAVFRLANWLYENDFVPDSAAVFRFYIRNYPRGDDLDRVNLGLGVLLARRLGQPAAAREYLLAAIDLAGRTSPIAHRAREELERIG